MYRGFSACAYATEQEAVCPKRARVSRVRYGTTGRHSVRKGTLANNGWLGGVLTTQPWYSAMWRSKVESPKKLSQNSLLSTKISHGMFERSEAHHKKTSFFLLTAFLFLKTYTYVVFIDSLHVECSPHHSCIYCMTLLKNYFST